MVAVSMALPPPNVPSVAQLFQDRSIFVTGGTGFMGKVLVEKLLRCCPGISKIYLLVRPKRGQDIQGRLIELINCPLFDKIREERPAELKKIIPIKGDVTSPQLGISPSDQQILVDNVSIVFHSAATVKFDEALKLSVTINMLGTKRLVELCHRMLSLEALIHVSTAYCNCDREEVAEVIYPPPYDPERIIEWMDWMSDDLVDSLTPRLIGDRPNTYTFTKALAESMLMKEAGNLPVAIVRPSIVLSSASEPVAGWVDNLNGPTGIIAAAGKGFFRTMLCHGNKTADLIPVDLVVNLMICAAWRTATERPYGIPVYNCVSGQRNPITWKEFVSLSFDHVRRNPLSSTLWYPDGQCRSNPLTNWIMTLFCHTLPAHILDTISRIFGKKPMMVRVQNKLTKASKCLEYFSTRQWRFRDENVRGLLNSLSSEDRTMFPFDPSQIVWLEYVEAYILGIRHFIFKETPDSLPRARGQIQRLYWMHRVSQIIMVLIILKILFATSTRIRKSWFLLVDIILRLARMLPLV